jgi:CAAX protease family protein
MEMTTHIVTPALESTTDEKVRSARQSLLVFAAFLIPLSILGYWLYGLMGDELPVLPSLPMMVAPGVAGVLTRLVRREGFADVSFRLRVPRMGQAIRLAFAVPLAVGIVGYGLAYLLGLAQFAPPAFPVAMHSPLAQYAVILLFAATVGLLFCIPTSAGEEIGWRGYLLPRMIDARIPQPILLSSLIWGAWHLPVVFMGVYAVSSSRWISAAGIMVAAIVAGTFLSWLRLGTGSVWAAVAGHAVWNALINAGFTFATPNHESNIWIGEQGVIVLAVFIVAVFVIRGSWKPTLPVSDGDSHA